MQNTMRRLTAVVLSAVLLFMMAFPVPSRISSLDLMRYKTAQANPAVLAVPAILATAAAAYGVYVTGASVAEYEANVQALYDGYSNASSYWSSSWAQYCQEKGSFDAAMQSCVTADGNISLQTLTDAGFWDGLNSYTAYCVNNGTAVAGDISTAGLQNGFTINGYQWNYWASPLPALVTSSSTYQQKAGDGYIVLAYRVQHYVSNGSNMVRYDLALRKHAQNLSYVSGSNPYISQSKSGTDNDVYTAQYYINADSGVITSQSVSSRSSAFTAYSGAYEEGNSAKWLFNPDVTLTVQGQTLANTSTYGNVIASVKAAVLAGTQAIPTATVQPFEPTAEQLTAGYTSADIVEAINSGTGQISGDLSAIASQIASMAALLTPVATMAANVQAVRDNWDTWAATTFGNTMETVIDGQQDVKDSIDGAGAAVLGGIQALPGQLEGVLEGVIEGVNTRIGAVATSIDGVISAVQSGVLDLTGALDSALHPTIGTGTGVALAPAAKTQFDATIRQKAPFCYVLRAQAVGESVAASFSSSPSFYLDIPIPYSENPIRFDAGMVLNQEWGGYTVAQYMRIMLTSVLCAGLIVLAIKVAMRTVGSGTGD